MTRRLGPTTHGQSDLGHQKTCPGLATTQSGSLNQSQCVSGMSGDAHAVTQQLGDDLSVNQAPGTNYPQKLRTTGQQLTHHRTNTTPTQHHTTQTVNIKEPVNITTSQHNESTAHTPQDTSQQLSPQNTSQQLPHHNTTVNTTTQTQHQHTTTPPHKHRTAT